ncbi:hypothetical protein REPUB_Repub06bG0045200 [Reevesia pubescens]
MDEALWWSDPRAASRGQAVSKPRKGIVCCCPGSDEVKFNVDGSSIGKPGAARCGGVLRDMTGIKSLIMESDSLIALSWIRNKGTWPWKEWKIFKEIYILCKQIGDVKFAHSYREANSFADNLAKMGGDREDFFIAFW